jgi:anti-sigma factor RsiW
MFMQCRDFREVSEAYLSDELLVETNLHVFRHMENCQSCRSDFAARRALRNKVRSAVVESPEFAVSKAFERELAVRLREKVVSEAGWRRFFAVPRILVPGFAALLIAVFAGFVVFQSNFSSATDQLADVGIGLTSYLTKVSFEAIGNHKNCALEKMEKWEAGNLPVSEDGMEMASKVIVPLRASFADDVEILHSHDCIFEGRRFSHVIVRRGGRTLSVFFDRSNESRHLAAEEGVKDSIICNKENGMQVASFRANGYAVFVVSDMPEPENLEVARSISDSMSV